MLIKGDSSIRFMSYNVNVYKKEDEEKEEIIIAVDSISILMGTIALLGEANNRMTIEEASEGAILRIFDSIEGQFHITNVIQE